ncbi:MAG: glycosyltransferase family 39 protein [Candidatus Caenarcaniphilales bacterium]|nr:glycosyltransferase family 39 protein [Candidatus Caenarcaniphilales bacterium]
MQFSFFSKFANKKFFLFLITLSLCSILRLYDLFEPYGRTILSAGSTSFWHIAGENFLNYGFWQTWLTPHISTGLYEEPLSYYNHPPLTGWILGLLFLVFGASSVPVKLLGFFSWLFVSFLIFQICKKRSLRFAYYSSLVSILLPFTNLFSNTIDCIGGPFIVIFIALLFYSLESRWNYLSISIVIFLGALTEWTFAFMLLGCLMFPRYKSYRKVILISSLLVYLAIIYWFLTNSFMSHSGFTFTEKLKLNHPILLIQHIEKFGLFSVVKLFTDKQSINNHVSLPSELNLWKWFSRVFVTYIGTWFTPIFYFASFKYFVSKQKQYLPLLAPPLFMLILFPYGAYKHLFWVCSLVPFASLVIGKYIMSYSKKLKILCILIIVSFSLGFTIHTKEKDHEKLFQVFGTKIKNQSISTELIVASNPSKTASKNMDRLLLGLYSQRSIHLKEKTFIVN